MSNSQSLGASGIPTYPSIAALSVETGTVTPGVVVAVQNPFQLVIAAPAVPIAVSPVATSTSSTGHVTYWLPTSVGSEGGGGEWITFRPGGTASAGVYTTEPSLSAAAMAAGPGLTILFDLSHVGGNYTFTTVGNLNLGAGATWTDGGFGYGITFANGTTLTSPPALSAGSLSVTVTQVTAVNTITDPFLFLTISGAGSYGYLGTGPWITVASGGELFLSMEQLSGIQGSGQFVCDDGGFLFIILNNDAFIYSGVTCNAGGYVQILTTSATNSVAAALYPYVSPYGYFTDFHGTGVTTIPAAYTAGLLFDQTTGILWRSTGGGGAIWVPESTLSGRTTLVNGVSPSISIPYLSTTSRITMSYANPNGSTGLGALLALESSRTNGTPGSFVITSLIPATVLTQTGDQSDVDWQVVNQEA